MEWFISEFFKEIVTFALTLIKYGRSRRETIVLYFKKIAE